jgi:Flp pilus assembly protein TadG
MVEFAMVIPIFLLVLSGIIDFGFALFDRMTVINAAREGARAAVMVSDTTTIPTVAPARARAAATQAGLALDPAPSSVTFKCIQGNLTTTSPCNFLHVHDATHLNGAQTGDSVSVTVNYTYQISFPMLTLLSITSFNLSSTVQMVIE